MIRSLSIYTPVADLEPDFPTLLPSFSAHSICNMPSLEIKTNVKLEDPKAFVKEFSTVRPVEDWRTRAIG